jgi:eukaryotic-like serine/threonine-protein kinase
MSNATVQCPPADALAAFVFGELNAERASAVQLHISVCEACLETVGYLAVSKSSGSATGAFESPGSMSSEPGSGDTALSRAGQVIGQYRLVRKLGEGGMGEVWEADQLAPVRRTVALKLLKAGMDTRQIVARFAAERQVLALMQHPGIAQMFDAGVTAGGRSYFVMEYVDGVRITEYCDRAGLGVTERLRLIQQVCDAVQHAHQKGVIHRDIKPSNVLITKQDGRALPKVIDFGLAKLTSQDLNVSLTEAGTVLGTPAYASPEQMSLGVIDVDTRSDVYSLGVLLYELLVGVIPFEADESHPAALLELRRSIRELEPTRPSARLSRLGDRGSDLAKMRGTDTGALCRQLRGDLDWIVMKALEKDRSRRYASPGDLARDTQRFLEHEPVLAGSPTAMYRLGKFVRRHRLGTAFAAALLSLVVTFAIVSAVQVKRIAAERDRATAEAAKSSSINTFLQETLGAADPWQTGADMSVRSTLATAAKKIDGSFKEHPLIAAAVRRTIGKTYTGLGRFDDAEPLLRAALKTRLELLGHEHPDVAESLADLAALDQQRANYDLAAKEYREVLAMRRKLFGENDASVADTLLDLAAALVLKGDIDAAYAAAQESLAIRERLFGRRSLEAATVLAQMGEIWSGRGDFARAEDATRRGYEISNQILGSDDARTALAASDLGATYYREGQYDKAEKLYRSALQVLTRQVGENNPDRIMTEENLAGALLGQKKYDDTIALMDDVLARRKAVLGDNNRLVARTLVNIATVLSKAGRLEQAQRAYAEAVPLFIATYGPNHPDTAFSLYVYGVFRNRQHDYAEAERLLRQALAIQASQFGDDHPSIADTRFALGEVLTERGQFSEAETMLSRAHEVMSKTYGAAAPETKEVSTAVDKLHDRMKKGNGRRANSD